MKPDGTVNAGSRDPRAVARRDRLVLVLAGLLLFVWRVGSHDLWPPDEPRFALVAKEMRQRGDYSVLSLNDHLYTDKPPLFFWAVNACALLRGGVDEWAARLPSALSGLLALLLIYDLGRRLYDRRTGLYGALLFATSQQIVERARWASIDMTLNLFVLAAIVLLWKSRMAPDGGRGAARWAWVLMGLATLAKGPVGLLLPLLAVLPTCLIDRDRGPLRRLIPPSGIALYLAVTLSWFGLYAARLGTGFALTVLVHQNVERYVEAWNAQHPIWYYLWRFPAGFFPWIVFLPWGIAEAFAREGGGDLGERRRPAIFLVTWMAAILLFFSFSTGKRGVYVIPIYPAAALLVGRLLARASGGDDEEGAVAAHRRLRLPLRLWTAVAALLAIALPLIAVRRYPELALPAIQIGVLLLAGAVAALILARRRSRTGAPAICLLGSAGM
ncbi:MAG TPA: glycosyltransferase family 39 protein, partial [Candidatus Polarisedimenticolia bacterium]|nr:glycosyltransferase family 39 protein [Candidatus Polarisedimenticolia bacterium]